MVKPLEGSPEWLVSLVTVEDTHVELAMTLEDAMRVAARLRGALVESASVKLGRITIARVHLVNSEATI